MLAALVLAAVAPATASASGCTHADAEPTRATLAQARAATLCLINQERRGHGLSSVRGQKRLRIAATSHSRNMVRRGFLDHSSPTGRTTAARVRAAGYLRGASHFQLGENLGMGEGVLSTPRVLVTAWMASPSHRFNILHASFRDVGIGIVLGTPFGSSGATYTTDFGVRR